jgi:hypothetical protein
MEAHLEGANLMGARLEGADLWGAHLERSMFEAAIVDGATLIWNCTFDEETNFIGVGLNSARVDPDLKEVFEGNIRKMRWLNWYGKRRFSRWPVLFFWWMSDYGRSTLRVILSFFAWALIFACIYYVFGSIDYYLNNNIHNPGFIKNLFTIDIDPINGRIDHIKDATIPVRTLYFSIVTMTTLGLGDMCANPESWVGHLLLAAQVLLGYTLLAVLVTRLAVLFTAGGPGEK